MSNRWSLAETPAIRTGGRRALALAGVGIDDVAIVDLYSCFPSAVRLGAASLGLDLAAQLTRTGGLSFAGGPWNNYAMHAIATIVGELRDRPAERALVWANGGYLTKHSFGIYAATPPPNGFRHDRPQQEIDGLPVRPLADGDDVPAAAVEVEAYTVMHDRGGTRSWPSPPAGWATADGRGQPRPRPERPRRSPPASGWAARSKSTREEHCMSDEAGAGARPRDHHRLRSRPRRRHRHRRCGTHVRPRRHHDGRRQRTARAHHPQRPRDARAPRHRRSRALRAARPLLAEPIAAGDVHGASGLDGARSPSRHGPSTPTMPLPSSSTPAATGRDLDRRRRPADERCPRPAPRPRPRRLARRNLSDGRRHVWQPDGCR